MNKFIGLLFGAILLLAFAAAPALEVQAQPDPAAAMEPSFDVTIQLLVGGNSGTRGDLPTGLNTIGKRLKAAYGYENFRPAGTFMARVANNGHYEYKSMSDLLGQVPAGSRNENFVDWSLSSLKSGITKKGEVGYQAQSFRFGARVPIVTTAPKDEAGRERSTVQYESIGVSLVRVGIQENVPTVIGTIELPGAGGTLFIVITIRGAEQ